MSDNRSTKIVEFPVSVPAKKPKRDRIKSIDGIKYYNEKQIKLLRRTVRDQAEIDMQKGKLTGIREWMAIDLLTSTGLRVVAFQRKVDR